MSSSWKRIEELIHAKCYSEARAELLSIKSQGTTVYGLDQRLKAVEKIYSHATELVQRAELEESDSRFRQAVHHLKSAFDLVVDIPGIDGKIQALEQRLAKGRELLGSALHAYENESLQQAKKLASQSLKLDPESSSCQRLLNSITGELKDQRRASVLVWSFGIFAVLTLTSVAVWFIITQVAEDPSSPIASDDAIPEVAESALDAELSESGFNPDISSADSDEGKGNDPSIFETESPSEADESQSDPSDQTEPELPSLPENDATPVSKWVPWTSGQVVILSELASPLLPTQTGPLPIPAAGAERALPDGDVVLLYQGLPRGVVFKKDGDSETARYIISDATTEIAEIHLEVNQAGDMLRLSAFVTASNDTAFEILGGTSLVFQSAGRNTIYFIEETVEVFDVDPITFPFESTTQEKVTELPLSASHQVVGLEIDRGESAFELSDEQLRASLSATDGKVLEVQFTVTESTGKKQVLDLSVSSSISGIFTDYAEVRSEILNRSAILDAMRKYVQIFEEYKAELEYVNTISDRYRARQAAHAAQREMLSEVQIVDEQIASLGFSRKARDYLSGERANSHRGIQRSIDAVEHDILRLGKRLKEIEDASDKLRRACEGYLKTLTQLRAKHEFVFLSKFGIPIAKCDFTLDISDFDFE